MQCTIIVSCSRLLLVPRVLLYSSQRLFCGCRTSTVVLYLNVFVLLLYCCAVCVNSCLASVSSVLFDGIAAVAGMAHHGARHERALTHRVGLSSLCSLSLALIISVHLFCLFMYPLSCFRTRLLAFSRKSRCRRRQTRPVGVTCGASTTAMPARTAARGAISTTRRSKTASHLGTAFDKWRRDREE